METPQSRFHLLAGAYDFQRGGRAEGVVWDRRRAGLTLRPDLVPEAILDDPAQMPPMHHGAVRDRHGNWYWIAEDGYELCLLRPGEQTPRRFRPSLPGTEPGAAGEGAFHGHLSATTLRLSGLAVTEGEYLVAGTADPSGLLLFDLLAGSVAVRSFRPLDLLPQDLVRAPGGGLWMLVRQPVPAYWVLDRHLTLTGERCPLPGLDPIALEALPDGSVLVLSEGRPARVSHYEQATHLSDLFLELPAHFSPGATPYQIAASDLAFRSGPYAAGGPVSGSLFVADPSVRRAFAFSLTMEEQTLGLEPEVGHYLLEAGSRELVAAKGEVYAFSRGRWQPLVEQPTARYSSTGQFTAQRFDGKEPSCTWHRVMLDAVLPPNTQIRLMARAADDEAYLAEQRWRVQQPPYRRPDGSEIAYHDPFPGEEGRQPGAGTWETLLQHVQGRYLEVALLLSGSGYATPLLRSVRAYYPRPSYVDHLPQIYREEPASRSFLERYLANPEGILTAAAGRIGEAQALFDPRIAPAEYLDWLAGWFGVIMDRRWETARRRLFIAHAAAMFRSRGTLPGMVRAIRLAVEPTPAETIFTDPVDPYTDRGRGSAVRVPFRIVEGVAALRSHDFSVPDLQGVVTPDITIRRTFDEFLRFKYRRVDRLNRAHGLTGTAAYPDFDAVPLSWAESMDHREEWTRFAAQYLSRARGAHRFAVFVALGPDGASLLDLDLVRRVVAVEKPAHTHFEIKPNDMAFRVGYARLGMDTMLADATQLAPITLGRDRLAHGYLSAHPGEGGTTRPVEGGSARPVEGGTQDSTGEIRDRGKRP